MNFGEPQPHSWAWLRASSRETSHPDSRRAGRIGMRPGVRTGDSGMNTAAPTAAHAVTIIGSQNSHA